MASRVRRALIVATALGSAMGGAFLYVTGATHLEQRAIAAQPPVVARGQAVARHVDRARLMADLRALSDPSFEGREAGAPGGLRARAWVESQFASAGLAPAGATGYRQPFRQSNREAANLIGRIDGTVRGARTLVVSAHYDHLGIHDGATYPGADDNASGVSVLLAVARQLHATAPRHPVLCVAFDAEETGLRGAEALVGSPLLPVSEVALDINLDMVSRNDDNEIFATGTYFTPWLKPILQDVQRRSAVKILYGHDRPMARAGGADDWTSQSDHGVFHRAGVPFVYFGVVDHADYHRPTDTADKVDPGFFGDVADMIVEAVLTLDRSLP